MPMSFTKRRSQLLLPSLLIACGSSGSTALEDDKVPEDGPLYAMTVFMPQPDGNPVSYLLTVPSLEAGAEWSARDGIEGTMSNVLGIAAEPAVWTGDLYSPIIDRWGMRERAGLGLEQTVSFANLGVASVDTANGAFVTPELYVVFNSATGELVRWNPRTMELEGTLQLDLPGSLEEGYPWITGTNVRPDGTIIASWQREVWNDAGRFEASFSGTLVLNPAATQIIGRDEWQAPEGRGMSLGVGAMTSDGTVYSAPSQACEQHDDGTWTCGDWLVSRVLPGSAGYDRPWVANLSALTGLTNDWEADARVFRVVGDQIYFMLHQEEGDEYVATRWFVAQDDFTEVREVPGGELIVESGYLIAADGRLFVADLTGRLDDGWAGDTPFYEVTEDGFLPAFSIAGGGIVDNIVRIR